MCSTAYISKALCLCWCCSFSSLSEFEKFLTCCKEKWDKKQKEVEAKFLELSVPDKLGVVQSRPRKRKKPTKVQSLVQQDSCASYAAELQITFFKKVHVCYYYYCYFYYYCFYFALVAKIKIDRFTGLFIIGICWRAMHPNCFWLLIKNKTYSKFLPAIFYYH